MKSFQIALIALFLPGAAVAEVIRLSEPVEVTDSVEVFGAPLEDKGPGMDLATLVNGGAGNDGAPVRVTTRVAKVCQKKGCFFIAQDGAVSARVTFADYSFFLPTDSGGKQVTLVGTFSQQSLDAKTAAHLAEDLGEAPPADDAPIMENAIVASSVIVPRG